MPGPVSDAYDPEFGTRANAEDLTTAMLEINNRIARKIGSRLKDIIEIAKSEDGPPIAVKFSARELRIIRFCINRAGESL